MRRVLCACGCGEKIVPVDRWWKRHRYKLGHNSLRMRPIESVVVLPVVAAYYAALLDGEGSVGLSRVNHRRHKKNTGRDRVELATEVSIYNTYRPVLAKLVPVFGGGISLDKRAKDGRSPCYKWHVTNRKALAFLKTVFPFLQIKKKRAELLLAKHPNLRTQKERLALHLRLRRTTGSQYRAG